MEYERHQKSRSDPQYLVNVRNVTVKLGGISKGLGEAIHRKSEETINVLKVIDWFPFIGVWFSVKEITGFQIDRFMLNIKDQPTSTRTITAITAEYLLVEPLKNQCLWFMVFTTPLPFTLEFNTHETSVNGQNITRIKSTSREMFIYPRPGSMARKTYFHFSQADVIYESLVSCCSTLIEDAMYFLSGLLYDKRFLPLTEKVRSFLIGYVLREKRFSVENCFLWYFAETIVGDSVYMFIPPVQITHAADNYFGSAYQYKGILLISKNSQALEDVYQQLLNVIRKECFDDYLALT